MGLEEVVARLPSIFEEWDELDDELHFEYADQVEWLFRVRVEAERMAVSLIERARLNDAYAGLVALRDQISHYMNIPIEPV